MINGGRKFLWMMRVEQFFRFLPTLPALILYKGINTRKINLDMARFLHYTPYDKCCNESFAYLMRENKQFRSIFYYRVGGLRNILVQISNILLPGDETIEIHGKIKGGLLVHHSHMIIGPVRAGKNLTILPGVVIGRGQPSADGKRFKPILGDNVFIGAHAVIVGGINVGNNVTIGAGSVVTRNIPDDCIVSGSPAKIISRKK